MLKIKGKLKYFFSLWGYSPTRKQRRIIKLFKALNRSPLWLKLELTIATQLKGVGDPMLRGYYNIISVIFRGRVIWFLMLKTLNSVRLHWVFQSFYIFFDFLTKNTHYLCQNSKFLCHFLTTLLQMIELSELYQIIWFLLPANEMARSYWTNTESV